MFLIFLVAETLELSSSSSCLKEKKNCFKEIGTRIVPKNINTHALLKETRRDSFFFFFSNKATKSPKGEIWPIRGTCTARWNSTLPLLTASQLLDIRTSNRESGGVECAVWSTFRGRSFVTENPDSDLPPPNATSTLFYSTSYSSFPFSSLRWLVNNPCAHSRSRKSRELFFHSRSEARFDANNHSVWEGVPCVSSRERTLDGIGIREGGEGDIFWAR